jgi:hypothetical protein
LTISKQFENFKETRTIERVYTNTIEEPKALVLTKKMKAEKVKVILRAWRNFKLRRNIKNLSKLYKIKHSYRL